MEGSKARCSISEYRSAASDFNRLAHRRPFPAKRAGNAGVRLKGQAQEGANNGRPLPVYERDFLNVG